MQPHPTAPVSLRPMDIGDIMDASFKVFRFAWKPMLLISLFNAVPIAIFTGVFQSFLGMDTRNPNNSFLFRAITSAEMGDFGDLGVIGAVYAGYILIYMLTVPLVNAALTTAIWDVVLGSTPTAGNALRRAAPRYFALLGTSLLKGLLALVLLPVLAVAGLLLLSIPAVICGEIALFVYFAFNAHAIVLERKRGGIGAMKRSFQLVRGRFWPLLSLAIVFYVMSSVVSGLLTMVITIPTGIASFTVGTSGAFAWLNAISTGVGQLVVVPLVLIGETLAYFDTRVRKEGLDLELIALAQHQAATQQS